MQLFPASCCCHICTESKGHFTQITRRKQSFSLIFSDFVACSVEICVLPGPLMCSVLEQQEFYFTRGPKLDTSTGKYQGSYIFIALEWAVFKPFSGQAALQSFCAGVDFMEGGKKRVHGGEMLFSPTTTSSHLSIITPTTFWRKQGPGGGVYSVLRERQREACKAFIVFSTEVVQHRHHVAEWRMTAVTLNHDGSSHISTKNVFF